MASKDKLGFGCVFLDVDLDGALDLAVVNGHIDDTVRNVNGCRLRTAAATLSQRRAREFSTMWRQWAAVSVNPKLDAALPMETSTATAISTC